MPGTTAKQTHHLRSLQTPTEPLLLKQDDRNLQDTSKPESQEVSIDCSLEVSNDFPLCGFGQSYGLCQPDAITATIEQMYVPFDYEVYFTTSSIPLDFFQGLLLRELAGAMNIPDCDSDAADSNRLRKLLEDVGIVGLTTGPSDQVDVSAACQAMVESSLQNSATCQRVEGQVTAYHTTNTDETDDDRSRLSVSSTVLKQIRSLMNSDDLLASGPDGSIERVIFMGQRMDDDAGGGSASGGRPSYSQNDFTTRGATNDGSKQSISGIGVALLAMLCLSVVMGVLLIRRRYQAGHGVEEELYEVSQGPHDLEKADQGDDSDETGATLPELHLDHDSDKHDMHVQKRMVSSMVPVPNNIDEMADIQDPEDQGGLVERSPRGCINRDDLPEIDELNNDYHDRTLASMSEPEPMLSWVDDEDTSSRDPSHVHGNDPASAKASHDIIADLQQQQQTQQDCEQQSDGEDIHEKDHQQGQSKEEPSAPPILPVDTFVATNATQPVNFALNEEKDLVSVLT